MPSRRTFLAASASTAALVAIGRLRSAGAQTGDDVFAHGVASGDPLADAVIIWTRVTPSAASRPGSGVGPDTVVRWEVATTADFATVLHAGTVTATPASDHTVKIDVSGLQPATDHFYRFSALDSVSPVGRARTLPAEGATPDCVRLGLVTCAEWEFGFFGAYRSLAERDDVDAVLHLGDYIYEFGLGYGPIASPGSAFGRTHRPERETTTLADYRVRYGQYRSDAGALALHAAHPMIVMYDDHEIANDTWRDGAENHSADEGDFATRAAAARQAFREWLPIRVDAADPERVHRRFRFGDLVELWMLDERRYRDALPESAAFSLGSVDPAIEADGRSMLGAEQKAWLRDTMQASSAAWKVLGNPVPMIPQNIGPEVPAAMRSQLEVATDGLPVNRPAYYVDDWNGYVSERNELFSFFDTIDDVVVLTGDYHESFASELPADLGSYAVDGASVAVEFVTPSVTSPGYSETVSLSGAPLALTSFIDTVFLVNFTTSNRWIKYHDGFENGYGVVEFTDEASQFDFVFVGDRRDPATAASVGASWASRRGTSTLVEASGPIAPRTRTTSPTTPGPPDTGPADTGPPRPSPEGPTERLPATGSDATTGLVLGGAAAAAAVAIRRRVTARPGDSGAGRPGRTVE